MASTDRTPQQAMTTIEDIRADTIFVYAAFVAVPRLGLQRFGAFVGIDFAFAEVPHRVVLGRAFLENVILIYDGFRAQVTFASSPNPD